MRTSRTRVMVEIALTIALAAVLHFVRIWQMPAGGSVSLDMLPLFVLGIRRGPVAGLVAGALYGFVDFQIEPYFVHWVQLFLDYPIAYAAAGGLAGLVTPLWRWRARASIAQAVTAVLWIGPLGIFAGSLGRYASHFISGVVFFATTAMGGPLAEGQSAFGSMSALTAASIYSAIYNLYVPVSALLCAIPLIVILPTLEIGLPTGDTK